MEGIEADRPLVLVADDDMTIRLLARETLALTGFMVEEARDGVEAVDAFQRFHPSVVLLDVAMPEMDGYSACSAIRALPGGKDVPIFMITGFDDIDSINQAYETGATDFITKPINWLILGHRVNHMLRAQKTLNAYRRSESKNRALLDAIPDLIVQVTKDGRITDFKAARGFNRLLMAERLNGEAITDVLPKELAQSILQHVERALATRKIERFDYPFSHNGTTCHYESRIVLSGDNEAIAIVQDVTSQRAAEEVMRKSMENLRRAMAGTIQVISSTVECKDPYTAGHQRRVAALARAIAAEMKLPGDQIDAIRIAGVVHDLGKISVPAEILSKPGRLTEMEFNLIKHHPQVAYDILKPVEFPWPIADIVLQHHERMDGSGYPCGLKGTEILLEARIIAVADVVEGMASHRPYRPMLGIDEALEEVVRNRGIAYDEAVADACLSVLRDKGLDLERL